jgi:replicative DNA helicase
MDIERALISKIISTGQLEEVVSRGIRFDFFSDPECQDMFKYLAGHVRRYKVAPSSAAVKEAKPGFEYVIVQDPLNYLIDEFVVKVKRLKANEMLRELAVIASDREKSRDIELHFMEISRTLATMVPSIEVHNFARDMESRIIDYERKAKEGVPPGIPFGFPTLDRWTGGIQSHEFVTVMAPSGVGKSTMLMKMAFNAWMAGKTPLVISLEMEKHAIARKFDAMFAGIDYNKIKHLELPEVQLRRWRQKLQEVEGRGCDIPIIDSIRECTPDHVFAETVRHSPDIVFIDYLSLMRSSRPNSSSSSQWQTITEITQDMKQNARTLRVPMVAAAQTNREGFKRGVDLENVGQSISIVWDSDIIVALWATDEMKEANRIDLNLLKNRDGRLGQLRGVWDHKHADYREWRDGEELRHFQREEQDRQEDELDKAMEVAKEKAKAQMGNPFEKFMR